MDVSKTEHRTSVVTVSFRSGAQLINMLRSLPAGTHVVIVNNAPDDDLGALAAQRGDCRITLINNPQNAGFGSACNTGARHVESEFILFLNPDAELKPGCLEALEDAADRFPDAVAFNPAMSDARGNPLFKRSSVLLPRAAHLARGWPKDTMKVPVLNGAAFFVRKAAFDKVGGFDERIFLYHEDDDLSLRLARDAGDLMFVRTAEVTHQAGHSTVRSPETAALKAYHMGRSRVYATRKHEQALAGSRAVLSALLQAVNPITLLSARKRSKQIAFLKGVTSAIREGATS